MSTEIDLAQIKRAAHNAVPLTFKTYTLPHETEIYLDSVLESFLGRARAGKAEGAALLLPARARRQRQEGQHQARLLPGKGSGSQQRQGIRNRDEDLQAGDIRQHPVLPAEAERAGHVHQGHLPDQGSLAQHHRPQQRRDLAQGTDAGIRPPGAFPCLHLAGGSLRHSAGQHRGRGPGHRHPRPHDEEDRAHGGLLLHRQRGGGDGGEHHHPLQRGAPRAAGDPHEHHREGNRDAAAVPRQHRESPEAHRRPERGDQRTLPAKSAWIPP